MYDISYDNIKIGDHVPDDQIQWATNIEVSPDGTRETVYRYFYYGLTDDTGVNLDSPTKQYYGGRQELQFVRDKFNDGTFGRWQPVTDDTFPEYIYKDYYHPKGYGYKYGHAPALKYDPNDSKHNGDFRIFDPYSPLYKVSIIDDTTGRPLKVYEENPVPEQGYPDTLDQAEQTNQKIYDQVNDYLQNRYTKVSDDFGQISVNNADNSKHSEGTEEYAKYVYTIHLVQIATEHVAYKTLKRTIHFVADDASHTMLQQPQEQLANLTMIYYTDLNGNHVNAKKNAQGQLVVDNNSIATDEWTVDPIGNRSITGEYFDRVQQDQITAGNVPGTWNIVRVATTNPDGAPLTTKYAPAKLINREISDGSNEDVYLVYHREVDQPTTPGDHGGHSTTPSDPTDHGHHNDQPTTPSDPGDHGNQPTTPTNPSDQPAIPGDHINHGGQDDISTTSDKPADHVVSGGNKNATSTNTGLVLNKGVTVAATASNEHKLPQTGNVKESWSLAGLGLLSMMGLYGLRKKHD